GGWSRLVKECWKGSHWEATMVDYTGRMFRDGKAAISAELSGILERLGSDAERWCSRLEKVGKGRLLGRGAASGYAKRHTPWACISWRTRAVVLRADTN